MIRALVALAAISCVVALNLNAPAIDMNIIRQVNANKKSTWKAGVNARFNGATLGQAKRLMGVKKNGFKLPVKTMPKYKAADLPTAFDARTQWGSKCPSVSEVRDQSACGSCWAFGAVEAITDRICIQSSGSGPFPHISAQDMNSCCDFCGMGCDGGDPGSAWFYWSTTGVVDGGNYQSGGCDPYTLPPCEHHINGTHYPKCPTNEYPTPACQSTCSNSESWSQALNKGKNAYNIDSNPNDIMQEIYTNGPVEVAFTVYSDFLTYKSGVYQYQSGDELGGHAVKMLGWGVWTDGTPYWICANSWNADWGNGGFFNILRGQDECGIEDDVCAGMA
jgi:cathepsin B